MKKIFAGVDVGSTTTEMVVVDEREKIVASSKTATAGNVAKAYRLVRAECLDLLTGCSGESLSLIATGYGRAYIDDAKTALSEIICYGAGANYIDSEIRTVIDIGGQDAKVIKIDDQGKVLDFAMNDKCAAGTGRFLEMLAHSFQLGIDDLSELAQKSTKQLSINMTCAVFAESEIISLMAQGEKTADLLAAAHRSVAKRAAALLRPVGLVEKVLFCGGVARNSHISDSLGCELGVKVMIPESCQMVGALGAAIIALRKDME